MPTLDQIFFCAPIVLESFCCRTRAKLLINDSKTTGWVEKFWTGSKASLAIVYRSVQKNLCDPVGIELISHVMRANRLINESMPTGGL